MNKLKMTRLAASMAVALSLAACGGSSNSGSSGGGGGGGGGGGDGGSTTSPLVLDDAQAALSGGLGQLCAAISSAVPAESPLDIGGFLCKLDPTVNDLLDGPDSLLTGLAKALESGASNPSPEAVQQALAELQAALAGGESVIDPNLTYSGLPAALTSLTSNLPCALLTLARQECNADFDPAEQLQAFIDLFKNGGNPFAGTPLEPLGELIGGGSGGGGGEGPTGTPLDALLGPLQALLTQFPGGIPGGGEGGLPDGELIDALGGGLALLGAAIASAEPQVADIPVAANLVETLGDLFSGLGQTLGSLESAPTQDVGALLHDALVNVNGLLTNQTGLLGALAAASQQQQLIDAVASGNAAINDGIATLTGALDEYLLSNLDNAVLEPLLGALAPLTCTLKLFGDCDAASGDPAEALQGLLGALAGAGGGSNPLSGLIEQITGAFGGGGDPAAALQNLLTTNPLAQALSQVPGLSELFKLGK